MIRGAAVELEAAVEQAGALIAAARHPAALVSSWGSNEELAAFHAAFGARFACHVKTDRLPEPGERLEDELLIKPDKNPNRRAATALYPPLPAAPRAAFPAGCDLVLVWGEGCDFDALPPGAKVVYLDAWRHPAAGPRRRLPADQRADRAQRPLHELRRRGEPLRGLLRRSPPAWPMPRPCSPRSRCRHAVEAP